MAVMCRDYRNNGRNRNFKENPMEPFLWQLPCTEQSINIILMLLQATLLS